MKELSYRLVESEQDKVLAKEIVENYHSYVPTYKSVGRRLDWLIFYEDRLIGMIGIGSSTYPPCKDILRYLNISKEQYKKMFNSFANNWRFCMKEKIPNLGTQILKYVRNNAPIEWKRKYGDDLKYLITFVGGGNNGAVYLADNWVKVGQTAGLPSHKSSSMKWDSKEELKQKFVKPTGENKKIIFFKELKNRTKDEEKVELFDI
jgi:hypothetical protein